MMKKFILSVLLILVILSTTYSQSEQLIINMSSTSLPGLLTFENPKGSIRVTGYDGEILFVSGTLRFSEPKEPASNGLRRIGQNALDISAEVEGKNITLLCKTTGKTVDFDIKIPRGFSLKLRSLDNGNVEIVNINGEIEVENTNGDITLENIAGSAVLSSVYGEISAVFRETDPVSPMMFTSFEGDITITFPGSVNAKLKMKSEKGEILSDFDIKPLNRQSVVKNIKDTRVYSLEDWVVGSVNKGGPEYIIRTYNGKICIKKRQVM